MSTSVLKQDPNTEKIFFSQLIYYDTDTQSAKNGFFQAVDKTATTRPKKR